MRNTRYNGYCGPRLPQEMQMKRAWRVIEEELSEIQREVLLGYYLNSRTIPELAAQRGSQQKHHLPHPPPGGSTAAAIFEILSLLFPENGV